jgi:hypothetical protein
MIWFFERGNKSLRVETRDDKATAEYVLVVPRPDGGQQIERFKETVAFRKRLEALETQLAAEHWTAVAPPVFLKDGWKVT